MDKSKPIVISLGGSLVVPNGGIDTAYLSSFNHFIREKIADGWRFFVVVGGGATARHYIDAGRTVVGTLPDADLDWLGIHTTRLNAHLVRTIFHDIAHPRIIINYAKKLSSPPEPLVIAAGGKPGWSTDYDAVVLARDYSASALINLSNIAYVFDRDPKKFPDAKPLTHLTWNDVEALVGTVWKPGSNVPFDPIATRLAKKLALRVYIVGRDLANVSAILAKQSFVGTIIE